MALIFMESFDGYGGTSSHATKWSTVPTLITSSPSPRTGTHAGRQITGMVRDFTPGSQTLIVGFAWYWDGSTSGSWAVYIGPGTLSIQFLLELAADGKIKAWNGNQAALLEATSSAVIIATSWNFIECKVNIANSGSWTVKCNGTQVLNGSGDTQAQSASTIGSMRLVGSTGVAYDDLYLLDSSGSYLNDFIGDCKVECLTAQSGNGTNTGLTTSTGSDHGALVDEAPANDDTDYNFGSSAGVKDTYNFTNPATTGTIYAVQTSIRAKKTDSGTKTLAIVARENSTDSDGTTQSVASTTYGQYQQIWEKRPSDNAAWTVSDLNSAEFGMKVVS